MSLTASTRLNEPKCIAIPMDSAWMTSHTVSAMSAHRRKPSVASGGFIRCSACANACQKRRKRFRRTRSPAEVTYRERPIEPQNTRNTLKSEGYSGYGSAFCLCRSAVSMVSRAIGPKRSVRTFQLPVFDGALDCGHFGGVERPIMVGVVRGEAGVHAGDGFGE